MQYEWLALALYILGIFMAGSIVAADHPGKFGHQILIGFAWPALVLLSIGMFIWREVKP
jgi:hypothetical protein